MLARTGLDDHEADRRLAQDRRNAGLDPGRLGKHAVAALGAVGAHGDELEPFVACFERANSRRADADDVPLPEVMHGVVQSDTARSADDDVRLLLLAVAVRLRRTDVGVVAHEGHAEMLGVEMLASEARLHPSRSAAESSISLKLTIVKSLIPAPFTDSSCLRSKCRSAPFPHE